MASVDKLKQRTVLKEIQIHELKGLKNCLIDFEKPLTAIMGVNGVGKSTILHALACCFQPRTEYGEKYLFCNFFPPTTNATWKNSKYTIRLDNIDMENDTSKEQLVTCSKAIDRWIPRYDSRAVKDIKYIGIDTCLPDIERFKIDRITFSTKEQDDDKSNKILKLSRSILNKDYERLTENQSKKKTFLGVITGKKLSYSSLSMGAGEQRVFKIVTELVSAPKYSLILIDEIDLLLHSDALKRLIYTINEVALNKHLQVVFTTHSLVMNELKDIVDIKYLENIDEKTNVYNGLASFAWMDLTGQPTRPIKVFVEDRFSQFIIKEIAKDVDIKTKVQIACFGAIQNAFTLAASFVIRKENTDNVLIVTDGDEYVSDEEKLEQISKHLTGTEKDADTKRISALSTLGQYHLPEGYSPEAYVHRALINSGLSSEIIEIAKKIYCAEDSHELIDKIADQYDDKSDSAYKDIVSLFAQTKEWSDFTRPIKEWLIQRKDL